MDWGYCLLSWILRLYSKLNDTQYFKAFLRFMYLSFSWQEEKSIFYGHVDDYYVAGEYCLIQTDKLKPT